MDINYTKYLPLSEATYYVLAALQEPLHGYALMQKVEAMSEGNVVIGPGTLYGAFSALAGDDGKKRRRRRKKQQDN